MALDQEVVAVVVAGRRAARVASGDQVGVLVGLGLGRLVVGAGSSSRRGSRSGLKIPAGFSSVSLPLTTRSSAKPLATTFAGLPLRGLAFGTPLMIWATATAATTRTTAPTAAPTKTRRTSLPFRSDKRPGGFLQRAAGRSGCRSVNNGAMHFDLPDDHRLLQQTVRDFADAGGRAGRRGARPRRSASPTRSWPRWASSGWMGIPFPEEVGGAGRHDAAVRARGRGAHAGGLERGHHDVRPHLARAPSRSTCSAPTEQKERAAARPVRGRKLGAFGLTEPEAGSDAGNVQDARARSRTASWVINGAKQFITNAGTDISGHVAITARHAATTRSPTSSSRTARRATSRASRTARWAGTRRTPAR